MFVPGKFSLFSPLRFQHPFFDPDPDPAKPDPAKPDPAKPDPSPAPKGRTVPEGAVVFDSQSAFEEALKDRLERAQKKAAEDAATAEAAKQGDFRKIVEEQYTPLKKDVDEKLTPELDRWRKLAEGESATMTALLNDDMKALVPANLPLDEKLDWVRKAVKAQDGKDPKKGNNPRDPDPKGTSAEERLKKLKDTLGINPVYNTIR